METVPERPSSEIAERERGELIDRLIAERLTDAQIAELGALFAALVTDVVDRRAARLAAEHGDEAIS